MKKNIHPKSKLTVFKDTSSDFTLLLHSTIETEETIKWEDGKTYPVVKLEISSKSHPFYTGKQKIVDTDNRVESFEKKMKKKNTKALKERKAKRSARRTRIQEIKASKTLTLKDMLKQMQ